jgi:hypothetical protein
MSLTSNGVSCYSQTVPRLPNEANNDAVQPFELTSEVPGCPHFDISEATFEHLMYATTNTQQLTSQAL